MSKKDIEKKEEKKENKKEKKIYIRPKLDSHGEVKSILMPSAPTT